MSSVCSPRPTLMHWFCTLCCAGQGEQGWLPVRGLWWLASRCQGGQVRCPVSVCDPVLHAAVVTGTYHVYVMLSLATSVCLEWTLASFGGYVSLGALLDINPVVLAFSLACLFNHCPRHTKQMYGAVAAPLWQPLWKTLAPSTGVRASTRLRRLWRNVPCDQGETWVLPTPH